MRAFRSRRKVVRLYSITAYAGYKRRMEDD